MRLGHFLFVSHPPPPPLFISCYLVSSGSLVVLEYSNKVCDSSVDKWKSRDVNVWLIFATQSDVVAYLFDLNQLDDL